MRKDISSFFNIEQTEKVSVLLFLVQSVFLGIFYGAFDVGAHALFLSIYPASMIPKAYVISGIAGIILTTLYARVQSKYKFSTLAVANLIFISLSVAFLRLLFQFTESPWLIFLIFIMMGPLNIIALLGFWGAVGRIFTLRQGKRLFGLIDSGQIFGAILSTFAIPILIAVGFKQKNLLFLSSVSVGCALIVQIIISIKYNLNQQVQTKAKRQRRLPELIKNKYILYMSVFVVMSMLAAFFIQYSFLSVIKDNYPDHNDLTEFLGAFTGSLLLFTFLFKTFVYSKLMKTYGLKVSIIMSSFILVIFTLLAGLIGTITGYTSVSAGFIFFFLIIALSRLFSKALKDAVEVPSFKILYQSLKAEIRHDVQAYVDGTINEIAALSAGLILAVLSLFSSFKLIHFSYSLMIILIIWFFIARKLYLEYKITLQKSLADYKGKKAKLENISDFVNQNINNEQIDYGRFILGLEIDSSLHPIKFEEKANRLMNHKSGKINEFIQSKVLGLVELNKDVLKINKSPGIEKLSEMSKSQKTEEKILAAFLMGKYYEPDLFTSLKSLIRDLQLPVKRAAIKAATITKAPEFCSIISEYINIPGLISYAYDSLLAYGEPALDSINLVFYKTGTTHRALLRITKLLGEIGGGKAIELLTKKLDHPNEEVLNYVLIALREIGFKAREKDINHIHQIINKHIGVIAWNVAANYTLEDISGFNYLKEALNDEIEANYDLLYLLLSLAYDSKSIMHVKENIESGTTEGISYALELLDLFIYEDIKPKLFPVLEEISYSEKIKQLQNFYPIEKLSLDDLLLAIVNRDINNTNIWTKSCAIYAFAETKNKDIPDDLIAHLFNPHHILRETAATVINNMNKEKFNSIKKRLKQAYREEIDSTIDLLSSTNYNLLVEKTFLLKTNKHLNKIEGRYLYELAKSMDTIDDDLYEDGNKDIAFLKNKILFIKGKPVTIYFNEKEFKLVENELYDIDELIIGVKGGLRIANGDKSPVFYIEKNKLIYNIFDFFKIEVAITKWLNEV